MFRPLMVLGSTLALALPADVAQAPPPLPVKVLMIPSPRMDAREVARNEAMLQSLASNAPSGGWFDLRPSGLDPEGFDHCTMSAQDPRSCVRRLLDERQATGATVVILVAPRAPGVHWLCVGTGARPTNPERQAVLLTPSRWDDAGVTGWQEDRSAAAGCIAAAGAESGW